MTDNLDDILEEIQRNRKNWEDGEENGGTGETLSRAEEERREKVASFRLNMDLDGEFGDYETAAADDLSHTRVMTSPAKEANGEETPPKPLPSREPAEGRGEAPPLSDAPSAKPAKRRRKTDLKSREAWGCAGSLFYVVLIIGISLVLACVIIVALLDATGMNKSSLEVRVTLEEGTSTGEIADVLKDNGIIDQKWVFVLYSKLRGVDGQYQSGVYALSASMGYGNIMDALRSGPPRTTVRVTIPEGYTVDQIAQLMEDNAVCTRQEFYRAVLEGDFSDYTFVAEIPAATGDYAGRGYALEGYLFPDTYEFYTGSSGETAVRKLLDGFDSRIDTTYKTKIAAQDMTINDVVILASIVQAEAADGEWSRVARVLQNRMEDTAQFPYLQCNATVNYYKNLDTAVEGLTISQDAYDTAVRKGLTPGAICNPGLHAINAVLAPSTDSSVASCYYFATDYSTGNTYYSRTYSEHVAICKKYHIGQYAEQE